MCSRGRSRALAGLAAVVALLGACGGGGAVDPATEDDAAAIETAIQQYAQRSTPEEVCAVITVGFEYALAGAGAASDSTATSTTRCPDSIEAAVQNGTFILDPLEYRVQETFVTDVRGLARVQVSGQTRFVLLYDKNGTWLIHAEVLEGDPLPSYFDEFNDVV